MCIIASIVITIVLAIAGITIYFVFFHNKNKNDGKFPHQYFLHDDFNHPFRDFVLESFIMSSIDDNGTCYNLLHRDIELDIVKKFCSNNNKTTNINGRALYKPDLYLISSKYFDTFIEHNRTVWRPIEQEDGTCYVYRSIGLNDVDEERQSYTFHPGDCGEYIPSVCNGVLSGTCSLRLARNVTIVL